MQWLVFKFRAVRACDYREFKLEKREIDASVEIWGIPICSEEERIMECTDFVLYEDAEKYLKNLLNNK